MAVMTDKTPSSWDDVRRLADELELKIHLASMDARDRWNELQPRLAELEKALVDTGQRAGEVVTKQLTVIGSALKQLRDEIADQLHT